MVMTAGKIAYKLKFSKTARQVSVSVEDEGRGPKTLLTVLGVIVQGVGVVVPGALEGETTVMASGTILQIDPRAITGDRKMMMQREEVVVETSRCVSFRHLIVGPMLFKSST